MQDAPTTLDVLDALATPVLQVGGDGRIRLANEAAARWLRVGRKRLLGLPLAALEREGQAVAGALAQSDGNPHLLRRVQLAFPGSNEALFADLWLSPIAEGAWCEAHPVDEFPGADPSELLPIALSASLKGLAHELRNPLAGIKGAAQLGMRSRLSINFLPNAIYRPEVCIRTTLAAARTHGFAIENIIFEATEGEAVNDGKRLAEILREYKRMGFLTAIDDFGAGYAGLNLLADFQPDIIKIDMELVRRIDSSRSRQAIARGVLRIGAELGIQVLAEGVETAAERDFFHHEGVTLMQGYLFSRPAFQAVGEVDPNAWPALPDAPAG